MYFNLHVDALGGKMEGYLKETYIKAIMCNVSLFKTEAKTLKDLKAMTLEEVATIYNEYMES
jgi:hypothetical protein